MEQINNITEEINNNVNVNDKPKKEYKFTEKRKLAYEKMREARKKKVEEMRNRKIEDKEKIPPPPKLKRCKAIYYFLIYLNLHLIIINLHYLK